MLVEEYRGINVVYQWLSYPLEDDRHIDSLSLSEPYHIIVIDNLGREEKIGLDPSLYLKLGL